MTQDIKIIGFDADDTLWANETYFRESEQDFYNMLSAYIDSETLEKRLYTTEMRNMPLYGYGVKAFTLSMIETALSVGNIPSELIQQVIELGKAQLNQPVTLLQGVAKTLEALHGKFKLVVVTKGDLLDQERKLNLSGVAHYFHHVEIMSDKQPKDYEKLLKHLDIEPKAFLMIGNSIKSDILPPLALGCSAAYVPYETTWLHEVATLPEDNPRCYELASIEEVLNY